MHNFADPTSVIILKNVRQAMSADSRLFIRTFATVPVDAMYAWLTHYRRIYTSRISKRGHDGGQAYPSGTHVCSCLSAANFIIYLGARALTTKLWSW